MEDNSNEGALVSGVKGLKGAQGLRGSHVYNYLHT